MLRPGELIAGKYRVEEQLGEGGMGFVVAAVHEQLQQRVAVKFLAASHAKDPDAAARFLREARAAVRIQSEHVARVIDVAELDDGAPYMVMEFLQGNDLAKELAVRGPFAAATAVDYILQACEALAEAHSIGLIHRDLKPANLFLTTRADGSPLVKVLDFGISKALTVGDSDVRDATLTSAQAILGSPAYMSPEQARTPKAVDMRTDIWALGVILYEFLTKTVPFTGDTMLSVLAATIVENQKSVRELRPELPPGIEVVVDRCLEKAAGNRYQTIAEFAEALGPYAEAHSHASILRVRGTVRRASSIPPAPTAGTTLKSNEAEGTSALPRASSTPATRHLDNTIPASEVMPRTDTLVVPRKPHLEASATTPGTVTAFGTSESRTDRPRRFVVIAAAVTVVLAVVAWRWFAPEPEVARERSTASEIVDPREAVPGETPRAEPTAAAPPEAAHPVIEPAPLDAQSAVGSALAPPEPTASASKNPKAPAAAPARPKERHPLDGRR